jgi:hypothetical protein
MFYLCNSLEQVGDVAGLRYSANRGSEEAALSLALLSAKNGDFAAMRELADSGESYADERLSQLLAIQDQEDELRQRLEAGREHAAWGLAIWLAEHGRTPELLSRAAGRRLASGASSARIYWKSQKLLFTEYGPVHAPLAYSNFKDLFRLSDRWARTRFTDLRYYKVRERGGLYRGKTQCQEVACRFALDQARE